MAYVELPDENSAPPASRPMLEDAAKRWGYAPQILRALAIRPDLMQAEDVWSKALMYDGLVPRRIKETVATTVSVVNDCNYCATSHAFQARKVGVSRVQLDACRTLDFEKLGEAERAAANFARKAAKNMRSITKDDVNALGAHFNKKEIVELVAVVGSFMMYNTFVTCLGLEVESVHGGGLLSGAKA